MGYENIPPSAPGLDDPNIVVYTFDPHVATACWFIVAAVFVLLVAWMIDMIIAEIKKNDRNDRNPHQ